MKFTGNSENLRRFLSQRFLFWIRSNVGELNNRINTTFKIVDYGTEAYEFSGSFISPQYEPQAFNEATGALGLSVSGDNGTASTPAIVSIQAEESSVLKKMYIVRRLLLWPLRKIFTLAIARQKKR